MGEAMLKDLIESVLPGKDNATVNTGCRFFRLFLVQIIYINYEVYDQYIFGIWSIMIIFCQFVRLLFVNHILWQVTYQMGYNIRRQIVTGLVSEKKIQYIPNKSINIILTKCWDTILFQSINQISADKNQVVGIVSCWFRYNLCQLHNLYQFYPLCVVIVIACHHFYIN